MLNSEYRAMLEFEQRGTVLAGIIDNPMATPYKLLEGIYDIVGDDLERYHEKSDLYIIHNHWIVFNPEERYWGVYYKKGHECVIGTRDSNSGSNTATFTNQYV